MYEMLVYNICLAFQYIIYTTVITLFCIILKDGMFKYYNFSLLLHVPSRK